MKGYKAMNEIQVEKTYWASVSGGKDSLKMLHIILENPQKYPLNGIVHWKLEIDYDFVENVCNFYKTISEKLNIPYYEIKPRTSYFDLIEKYDLPSRKAKWCNGHYKMDCVRQFTSWQKSLNKEAWFYIGFCADEEKRFKKNVREIYPLAIEGISENIILEWAKNEPIFNDFYKICRRQGCKYCPNINRMELAYLHEKYPKDFEFLIAKIREYEQKYKRPWTNGSQYIDNVLGHVYKKWIPLLNEKLKGEQKWK